MLLEFLANLFGGSGGGNLQATAVSQSQPLPVAEQRNFLTKLIDTTTFTGYTLTGWAAPGTAQTSATWAISRTDSTGNVLWANGTAGFVNAWSGRGSISAWA